MANLLKTWRGCARAAASFLLCLGVAFGAASSSAEEGMWTFDNFPAARMRAQMGWAPDEAWLSRVMGATVRLPGCSASIVSENGLALTNQHCIIACLQALSDGNADYLGDGFLARGRGRERRCPGMDALVLQSVSDVTARIDAAAAGAGPEGFARARDGEIARIVGECAGAGALCDVTALYQGGRYGLYRYRRFNDVRLVFAPELAMAAFGGAENNFSFPRHGADFALLRLYDDGAKAITPTFLALRAAPVDAGEVVLTAGNPGPTSRFRTGAQLAFERDVDLPWRLETLNAERARLRAFAAQGPAQARAAAGARLAADNAYQALAGRRAALADAAGFALITAREADLRARVQRNRAAAREAGAAWDEIARAQEAYRAMFFAHQYLELRAGESSELFARARDIVRAGAERQLPQAQRMPRYAEMRLAALERAILADRPVDVELEALRLTIWLEGLQQHVGADLAARVLAGEGPAALAQRLAGSRLADGAYRRQLWQGGAGAVAASDDPMIAFVRAWDDEARAVRARYQREVEAPIARAGQRIAIARFRAFGTDHYPDATFSPRLSYGRVEGWREGQALVGAFTHVRGLYEEAAAGAPISPRWAEAQARLNPDTVLNMASSNDVIGGNSGSPLLDREARVVGVVFDGNQHSHGGDYFYDSARNRAVSVSSAVILAALREVYGAGALVGELAPS